MKISKKSKYNLSDGEEDELDISGFGALSGRDDFEDEMLPDDDEDYGGEEAAGIESMCRLIHCSMIDEFFCLISVAA